MISAYLRGGLANIMFQVAAADTLATETNNHIIFSLDGIFNHHPIQKYLYDVFAHWSFIDSLPPLKEYSEPSFLHQKLPQVDGIMLNGYFQSWKYSNAHTLKKFIHFPKYNSVFYKYYDILKNSVAIHVRRGDYLNIPDHLVTLDESYYDKAIDKVYTVKDQHHLVFSDDIEWCKNRFPDYYYFIEEDEVKSLYLMSMCNAIICANSSFSTMAAMIGNPSVVIMPSQWFGPVKTLQGYTAEDIYLPGAIII